MPVFNRHLFMVSRSTQKGNIMKLKNYIANISDFPKPGILFRDMSPLLASPSAFKEAIHQMKEYWGGKGVTKIAGFDARGFIFGATLAYEMGLPFIMLRKAGKLPGKTLSVSYGLEYGKDVLEMQWGAAGAGDAVLLVDDVLATGGTANAGAQLLEEAGAGVAGLAVVIELLELHGRNVFTHEISSLVAYGENDE